MSCPVQHPLPETGGPRMAEELFVSDAPFFVLNASAFFFFAFAHRTSSPTAVGWRTAAIGSSPKARLGAHTHRRCPPRGPRTPVQWPPSRGIEQTTPPCPRASPSRWGTQGPRHSCARINTALHCPVPCRMHRSGCPLAGRW